MKSDLTIDSIIPIIDWMVSEAKSIDLLWKRNPENPALSGRHLAFYEMTDIVHSDVIICDCDLDTFHLNFGDYDDVYRSIRLTEPVYDEPPERTPTNDDIRYMIARLYEACENAEKKYKDTSDAFHEARAKAFQELRERLLETN